MNVYACKFNGAYCYGVVVVAANSEDEACKVIKNDERYYWLYSKVDENGNYIENRDDWREVDGCGYSRGYYRRNFMLLKGVTANVKTPQILIEDHYEE